MIHARLPSGPADSAIVGSHIRTLDPVKPYATAVAVRGGSIIAVGEDAEIRTYCDGATEIIDGRGLAIVPGLIDSHQHALSASGFARGLDVRQVKSPDELRDALAAESARLEPGQWLFAWGLEYNALTGGPFSNEAIEAAVQGRPTVIRIMDAHTAIASKAALKAAGVTAPVRFDDGAEVVCRDGVPTGVLKEPNAIDLVAGAGPPPTSEESRRQVAGVLEACASLGITQIHQMDGDASTFRMVRELEENGALKQRIVLSIWHKPGADPDQIAQEIALGRQRGRLWRGGVVKLFIDGVIDTGTSWLVDPDTHGGSLEPLWRDPREYESAVARFATAGYQCVTHATGDRGVRAALDAYLAAGGPPEIRHRIEHIETLQDVDVPRFAAQRVVASMQPLHMQWRRDDGADWWTEFLGPERAARAFRCKDLIAAGAVVPLGSDWPVADYDPRAGMAWARLRREPGTQRPPFEPEQRLTALQALEGYTTMAARAVGEEHIGGRIIAGYRADFTAFAEDPVRCSADDLVDLPILLTVVGGRVVFHQW